ncbi:hypothetical protein ADL26_15035 [Thermoactinomyces vulgaris]|jgi:RNA polymerase sigma factor|nr:hypothetical protein ADL26_15035 [Thermoactinomyces vulgaris]
MFRGTTDLEARVLQVQTAHSPEQRDDLLRELEPHVRRIASRVCRRVITQQDDEYMVAYRALDEALEKFKPDFNASFLSFAYKVIQRRLVDYFRQEGKHHRVLPMGGTGTRADENQNQELVSVSFERHNNEELDRMRRMEIEIFIKALAKFDISLNDLAKKKPKHRDTRENLFQIARQLVADQSLLHKFYTQKRPDKELAKALGMHRRTLSRHRDYLIALTIVRVEDLGLLRSYIGL